MSQTIPPTISRGINVISVTRDTARHLAQNPLHFFLVNAANLVPDFLGRWLIEPLENPQDPTTWAIVIPYLFLAFAVWTFCFAANILTVRNLLAGGRPAFGISTSLWDKFAPLLGASILIATVVALGLWAYVIPGIVVFCLYMFVPGFIVTDSAPSLMGNLNRSWRLTTRRVSYLFISLVAVFIMCALGFLIPHLLRSALAVESGSLGYLVEWFLELGASLAIETFAAVWAAEYFFELNRRVTSP